MDAAARLIYLKLGFLKDLRKDEIIEDEIMKRYADYQSIYRAYYMYLNTR